MMTTDAAIPGIFTENPGESLSRLIKGEANEPGIRLHVTAVHTYTYIIGRSKIAYSQWLENAVLSWTQWAHF